MQVVLHTNRLKFRARRRIELCPRSAVRHIDLIHVMHKFQRFLLADIFEKRTAEIVGDIVFPVGKRARTAKTAHNRTARAVDTTFNLISVNRTAAFFQTVPRFKYGDFQTRIEFRKLVSGKNPPGPRSDNNHVVFHLLFPPKTHNKRAATNTQKAVVNPCWRLVETLDRFSSIYHVFFCTP